MPHINLSNDFPGIRSLFMYRPVTAAPLNNLVQVLLHNPHSSLSAGERELIATYTSNLNACFYCTNIHGAIAKHQLGNDAEVVKQVLDNPENAPISNKLKALLRIAAKVQVAGKNVTTADVVLARSQGATDIEIHDTVLIAAAFCMYNRYVDGLATWQPDNDELYDKMGEQRAREGYLTPPPKVSEIVLTEKI
ncbi:carboxymuconolactone decarboxylase family protein [Mucilaginibacter xinganensis]|uniref:Carboxymuconolactone decarboxylase n=1 Tax=Mucilaginibacter xinganensis TaxID=1234841 RepID=A0A223NYF4_9SPHI|nr:peroxidase-related enzyme [Mucilaginibacter xinganensis]ASU34895.1 carboxymuconolactone decarboxylase [Mucilaginibacter xinganensis]